MTDILTILIGDYSLRDDSFVSIKRTCRALYKECSAIEIDRSQTRLRRAIASRKTPMIDELIAQAVYIIGNFDSDIYPLTFVLNDDVDLESYAGEDEIFESCVHNMRREKICDYSELVKDNMVGGFLVNDSYVVTTDTRVFAGCDNPVYMNILVNGRVIILDYEHDDMIDSTLMITPDNYREALDKFVENIDYVYDLTVIDSSYVRKDVDDKYVILLRLLDLAAKHGIVTLYHINFIAAVIRKIW